jgi:hypothetical protein
MLILFSGNDHIAIKKALEPHTKESERDGSHRRHTGEVTLSMLDPYFSESLFGETYVVVLDGISLFAEDVRGYLVGQMGTMLESGNTFILVDEKFSKEFKDEAKKQKINVEEFTKKEKEAGYSVFAFTDLYLARDKKGAWLALTRLFREGAAAEEVHGALFWAVKSLYLVTASGLGEGPEALGMKPYTYEKTKRFASKWGKEEASSTLKEMTHLLETTRKNGGDLGMALERLVLQ